MTGKNIRLKMIAALIAVALICPSASFAADKEYATTPYQFPDSIKRNYPWMYRSEKNLQPMNASTDPNKPFGVYMGKTIYGFRPLLDCGVKMPGHNVKAGQIMQFKSDLDELSFYDREYPGIIVDNDKVFTLPFNVREDVSGIGLYGDFILIESKTEDYDPVYSYRLFRLNGSDIEYVDRMGGSKYENDTMHFNSASGSESAGCNILDPEDRLKSLDIADFDNDGNPELRVDIDYYEWLSSFGELPTLVLFLEMTDSGLKVDFNPALYKPVYERAKKGKDIDWFRCITGYYAGVNSLEELTKCADNDALPPRLFELVKDKDAFNKLFHKVEREELIKYDVSKGRRK